MHKLVKDITGQQIGQWTVLSHGNKKSLSGKTKSYWRCRCSCGDVYEVCANILHRAVRQGKNIKCRKCAGFRPGAPQRKAYSMCRRNAFSRKLKFELSFEQFLYFSKQNCYYCGALPANLQSSPTGEKFYYSGIDRKDNNIGYMFDNCLPCCHPCNWAKGTQTQDDFIQRCKIIAQRFD